MAITEELRILLRTIADTTGARQTQQALKSTRTQAATSGSELLKMGAAVGVATIAVQQFVAFLGDSVQVTRDHERIMRATTASYGAQTAAWVKFSEQLSATTGFTSDAILEAALSARTLSTNYGLSIQQTQKLIRASADLARIRGIGVAEAFERVQSAIRGEAEASEYLGLTLNDTFIANNAMNGSLKTTFNTMTDQQKAQVRYNELLRQTADFAGLASSSADSLDGAFGRAATAANKLQLELGKLTAPVVITGLNALAEAMNLVTEGGLAGRLGKQLEAAAQGGAGGGGTGGFAEGKEFQRAIYLTEELKRAYARTRLHEMNENFPPVSSAADLNAQVAAFAAELAFLDQVDAAVREITSAQQREVELQRQSVDLAAQEASIRLQMLPAQQRMAELQRQVTEQQIRARQAALPATERLEDLRFEEQRLRLILQQRGIDPAEKSAARRELRALNRGPLAAAELDALVAGRGVTLAGRAAERVGLEQQLFQLTQERTLSQIQLAQETNTLLSRIAEQRTQAIQLTINMSGEGFSQQVYKELVEANQQAQLPPTITNSGVRR